MRDSFARSKRGESASMPRRQLLGGCASVGVIGLSGCISTGLDAEETISREYDEDVSTVAIETVNGEVKVRGEDRETISVEGTKRAPDDDALDEISLESESDDETLAFRADVDSSSSFFSLGGESARIDLTVWVPEELAVDADTTNGDMDLDLRESDDVTADTTNGDIAIAVASTPDMTAETTNGDVEIALPETAEPEISFDTTNGDIEVTGLTDSLDGDSSIETTIGDGTHEISVETTNGDLTVRSPD